MKIIYTDMVGDLFHKGHVHLLRRASLLGDKLIVGVLDDKSVESYKRIPICNLEERVSVIEVCKYVDKVIPNAPLKITEEFINEHNIDLVVHAHDKSDTSQNNFFEIPMRLGKFLRLEYTNDISTTNIIERCKNRIELDNN